MRPEARPSECRSRVSLKMMKQSQLKEGHVTSRSGIAEREDEGVGNGRDGRRMPRMGDGVGDMSTDVLPLGTVSTRELLVTLRLL